MILRALHTTTYSYSEPVSLCHTEVRLKPRADSGQLLLEHRLIVEPEPSSITARSDFFGNDVSTLTIDEPHTTLRITAASLIENNGAEPIHPALTPPWEQVRDAVKEYRTDAALTGAGDGCVSSAFLIESSISARPFSPMIRPTIFPSRPMKKVSGRNETPPYASPTASFPSRTG